MSDETRLTILVIVCGGVAAFLLPYLLPRDEWPILPRAILAAVLFTSAYLLAKFLDRVLPGHR